MGRTAYRRRPRRRFRGHVAWSRASAGHRSGPAFACQAAAAEAEAGPAEGRPRPGMAFASGCRPRCEQTGDRPGAGCGRRADRRNAPASGAEGGEHHEQEHEQRERRHHRPMVQPVRDGIGGRKIAPLRRGHPPGVDETGSRGNGCECEQHRVKVPLPREERPSRGMQREQRHARNGDSGRERQVPPLSTSSAGDGKRECDNRCLLNPRDPPLRTAKLCEQTQRQNHAEDQRPSPHRGPGYAPGRRTPCTHRSGRSGRS